MKAMILCAGFGSRLGELTRSTPKPLLPIAGAPLLAHILLNLKRYGFRDVVINLHFEADQIKSAIGDGSQFGTQVAYSPEPSPLGTAGGVKYAASHFSGQKAFLVHYGDIVTDQDLSALWNFHHEKNALVTLLVHHRSKSNSALSFDEEYRVREFFERPDADFWNGRSGAWVNSGIMIVSNESLELVDPARPSDWPRDVFPKLLSTKRLYAFPLSGHRIAVDSADRLEQARKDMRDGVFKLRSEP